MAKRTFVRSFEPSVISRFRSVGTSGIRTGLNASSVVSVASVRQAGGHLAIKLSAVDRNRVAGYQAAGIKVGVYTTDTDAEDRRALALGPDMIITDRAAQTSALIAAS